MRAPNDRGWQAGFVVLVALLAGCSSGSSEPGTDAAERGDIKDSRYVVLMNGNSPFWDAVRVGMEQAAEDLNVRAVLETNDATPRGQIDKLRQFASQSDIVAVGLSATDAANVAIADEMRRLREQGVHVITIDSDIDREKFRDARFAFVGTDNLAGGKELGVSARNLRPDGGPFVQFVGRTGAQNAMERMDGFVQGAGPKFEERDRMGDENDRSRAKENVRNALRNHPDVTTLVGIWSYNAPAIVDVVRELDRKDELTVVTFDAEPIAIQEMDAGMIDAMVVQNPYEMGYQGIRLMKALVEEDEETIDEMFPRLDEPGGDVYDTGLKVVVPDGGSPLEADMFGPSTQFLRLGEFQDWLAQNGLEGS